MLICICVFTCVCLYEYACAYLCVCIYISMYVYLYVFVRKERTRGKAEQKCMYTCLHVFLHSRYVCLHMEGKEGQETEGRQEVRTRENP